MNEAATHKDSSGTHVIWGVSLKTPTATELLASIILSLVLSTIYVYLSQKNWLWLCTGVAGIVWSSFAPACGIQMTRGSKHFRLWAAGILLIALMGALAYFILKAILQGAAH